MRRRNQGTVRILIEEKGTREELLGANGNINLHHLLRRELDHLPHLIEEERGSAMMSYMGI